MFKKILLISVAVLLSAYLLFSLFYVNFRTEKDSICKELRVDIVDTLGRNYFTSNDVITGITRAGLSPVGKPLSTINTAAIEDKLKENRLIKRTECYKTIDGAIRIKVYQRVPVLRVFTEKESYYVDNEGEKMPVPANFAAYAPVASGFIGDEYAKKQLYEFALFLQQDKFWNSQIKQIYIAPNGDVELTPAVGDHQIILGKIEDYKENLEKLRLFYEKGLSKVGWNKYSVINLKFKNQVVCTKKE
ncbi:MAG: cell division protein FtsQ [Candidatus Azobacteroides sp.]|nr:cell division protein FtsQ [Candidatus Azobacteroides sp.]